MEGLQVPLFRHVTISIKWLYWICYYVASLHHQLDRRQQPRDSPKWEGEAISLDTTYTAHPSCTEVRYPLSFRGQQMLQSASCNCVRLLHWGTQWEANSHGFMRSVFRRAHENTDWEFRLQCVWYRKPHI